MSRSALFYRPSSPRVSGAFELLYILWYTVLTPPRTFYLKFVLYFKLVDLSVLSDRLPNPSILLRRLGVIEFILPFSLPVSYLARTSSKIGVFQLKPSYLQKAEPNFSNVKS